MIEIDKRIRRPERRPKLLARHNLARILEQNRQHLKRLLLQLDLLPVFAQLRRGEVRLENAKAHVAAILCLGHCGLST